MFSADDFVDGVLQTLNDLELLRDDASAQSLNVFRSVVKVLLRMHKLRIGKFVKKEDVDKET